MSDDEKKYSDAQMLEMLKDTTLTSYAVILEKIAEGNTIEQVRDGMLNIIINRLAEKVMSGNYQGMAATLIKMRVHHPVVAQMINDYIGKNDTPEQNANKEALAKSLNMEDIFDEDKMLRIAKGLVKGPTEEGGLYS